MFRRPLRDGPSEKKGLHAFKQDGVDAVAHGVNQQNMVFLNAGSTRIRDVEQNVGIFEHGGDFSAVAAGHGDDVHVAFVCRFDGFDDVGGIAGGGDADQYVAGTSERAHLFAEYMVEP